MPRGPGRPEFQPTADHKALVEALAGYGIPHEEIAKLIINPETSGHISRITLEKHFERELDRGHVAASSRVIGGLFKNAVTPTDRFPGGIPVAQIFWLKVRERWRTTDGPRPPEPPPPQEETGLADAARRIAFALELHAKTARNTIDVTPRKVDA